MENRRFYNKKDLVIILLVIFLAATALAIIYLPRYFRDAGADGTDHNLVHISHRGETIMVIDLAGGDRIIDLYPEYGAPAKIEIKDHALRWIEVECPDHICMSAGYIRNELDVAVCMPNQLAATVHRR